MRPKLRYFRYVEGIYLLREPLNSDYSAKSRNLFIRHQNCPVLRESFSNWKRKSVRFGSHSLNRPTDSCSIEHPIILFFSNRSWKTHIATFYCGKRRRTFTTLQRTKLS
uniref:39S ribosomal protein L10 n=1 Tax=Schistocephalus solidus TaxID=70667 RepID=A0A0X3P567_SCHSO